MTVDRDDAASTATLILASTSTYRRRLLERLGVPFVCRAPDCDESVLKGEESDPRALAERLAAAKAASVRICEPDATIIGCDQLVAFRGRVFGKPGTPARAVEQLEAMSGQTHELITAMVVLNGERSFPHTDLTLMRMRPLSRTAIERYVAADRPLDCAGGYMLESRGIALFDQIETEDHTAITGLPLIALTTILRGLGIAIP